MAKLSEQIAKNIKHYRKEAGLTQNAAASQLNITQTAISHWESGSRKPSYDQLDNLAQTYGIGTTELVSDPADSAPDDNSINMLTAQTPQAYSDAMVKKVEKKVASKIEEEVKQRVHEVLAKIKEND